MSVYMYHHSNNWHTHPYTHTKFWHLATGPTQIHSTTVSFSLFSLFLHPLFSDNPPPHPPPTAIVVYPSLSSFILVTTFFSSSPFFSFTPHWTPPPATPNLHRQHPKAHHHRQSTSFPATVMETTISHPFFPDLGYLRPTHSIVVVVSVNFFTSVAPSSVLLSPHRHCPTNLPPPPSPSSSSPASCFLNFRIHCPHHHRSDSSPAQLVVNVERGSRESRENGKLQREKGTLCCREERVKGLKKKGHEITKIPSQ